VLSSGCHRVRSCGSVTEGVKHNFPGFAQSELAEAPLWISLWSGLWTLDTWIPQDTVQGVRSQRDLGGILYRCTGTVPVKYLAICFFKVIFYKTK
jgi:hypothetical protein